MAPVRRLAAHFVFTPDGFQRNLILTVDGDGTILGLSHCEKPDRQHGVEFYSGILVPGFVNAHTHLELSHMKGLIPPRGGFADFGKDMSSVRNHHTPQRQRESASYQDVKMWAEGISAAGDISNTDITLDIKRNSRVQYHTFAEVYGLNVQSTQRFTSLLRLMEESGLTASLTPHSMYSLSEELLAETVTGDGGIMSVHFMESRAEVELFARKGEMWKWYREKGFKENFTGIFDSPAERLIRNIPPDRKILLIHNTFVVVEDIERINDHFGANVVWVLCPRSNRYIENVLPPVEMLKKKGCRIAVGTDSLASNTSLSVLEELKLLEVPLEESLGWATYQGARALGMDDRIGTIEQGRIPGVVLIENLDMQNLRLLPGSVSRRLV